MKEHEILSVDGNKRHRISVWLLGEQRESCNNVANILMQFAYFCIFTETGLKSRRIKTSYTNGKIKKLYAVHSLATYHYALHGCLVSEQVDSLCHARTSC
jgi:hypothetical protein